MIISEKPVLKSRFEWHYLDIEEFVKNLWGQKWEGGAAMGFPAQDTYHDLEVTGGYLGDGINNEGEEVFARWMSEEFTYEQAELIVEGFKNHGMPREEYAEPSLELLLNWLAFEEHIPTGNYRVLVWW
jgi:hypothetical protein